MINDQQIVIDTGYHTKVLTKDMVKKEDLIYVINLLKDKLKIHEEYICNSITQLNKKNLELTINKKSKSVVLHNYELQQFLEKELQWIERLQKEF